MSLTGTTDRLTDGERAREPRSLAVVAWYDGWAQAHGMGQPYSYPRPLDPFEARSWREGFREGWEERATLAGGAS